MSIRKNTIANYLGQGYLTLVGIVVMPLYLQYLGAEAYGLVGFFIMLQTWLNLLDIGLSPAFGRQVAYERGQQNDFIELTKLLRSFEIIFFIISISTILVIYSGSDWISRDWIKIQNLDHDVVSLCVVLMGLIIGLRWFGALYKSGISGFEDQVWLNKLNIIMATGKFIGALLLLEFISTEVVYFFQYQMLVGVIEIILVTRRFYSKLPITIYTYQIKFNWCSVKKVAPFALGIAYTSGIWIVISKADKLILSGILPINEFGYFTLVSVAAGGVAMMSSPIAQAVLPRMTMLLSQGKKNEMIILYRNTSQLITVVALSTALVMAIFSEKLLFAWTGNLEVSVWGRDVLFWFALGNGVLALEGLQYYLQSSFGKLRLHIIGSTVSVLIQTPLIFYAASTFGAVGAGIAWFTFRSISFICWTPIVHQKFLPHFHMNWLIRDIAPIVLIAFISSYFLSYIFYLPEGGRVATLSILACIGLVVLLAISLSSSFVRNSIQIRMLNRNGH
jgi:O-antigen/teichoic acid export membrane protein